MKTLQGLAVAALIVLGYALLAYGLSLGYAGLTVAQARGNALGVMLALAGAALVILSLAGVRRRL
jgi:hypothetical protein